MNEHEQELIADLLVKWEEAFDEGHVITAEELCTDHPYLTQTIRQKIDHLKSISWTKRDPARPLVESEAKDFTGTLLADRYRLDQLLGEGGYGQVYRATDAKLHRLVAVKIGHHRTSCDLLLDEARRVARCPKHPGIVSVHDCGEHDGRVFLVFEYVAGQSLAEVVRSKKLTVRESVDLIASVAESLSAAHEIGLVHRDLKPENILIDESGNPLIADFGVACSLDDVATGRAGMSGTLAYMSPEILSGDMQLLDGRCDIHSLGVVLFELISGQTPFPAKDKTALREQILFRQPMRIRDVYKSVPVELDAICMKAMAKHPGDRYENVDEFAAALRTWLDDSSTQSSWFHLVWLGAAIVGVAACWLATQPHEAPLIKDDVLHFDGRTRIVTNIDQRLPVTLEAWIKPDPYNNEYCQFVIGSDVPGQYGLGIAICGSMLSVEHIEGMVNSSATVPPSRWSHIAAVFTNSETRLYFNGKLVETFPGSKSGEVTPFVIGNAGRNNLINFYRGQLRSVRISEGETYSRDFEPNNIQSDKDSLLVLANTMSSEDDELLSADGKVAGRIERY